MLDYWNKSKLEKEMDRQTYNEYVTKVDRIREGLSQERSLTLVRERVASLPSPERLAIYMRYWLGCSILEIATTLGMTKELVLKLVHNGLARLRNDLQIISINHITTKRELVPA